MHTFMRFVFPVENGISMFMWVGLQVNPELLQQLFHANTIGQVDIEMVNNYYWFYISDETLNYYL